MVWIEFINGIIKIFGSIPKKYYYAAFCALIIFLLYLFLGSEMYDDYFQEPKWHTETDEEKLEKKLCSDIGLKEGRIVVRPQLVVKYRDKIIFMWNIKGLLKKNTAQLKMGKDNLKNTFNLQLLEEPMFRLQLFRNKFDELLKQKRQLENKRSIDGLNIDIEYLVNIEYQNRKSIRLRNKQIICADGYLSYLFDGEIEYRKSNIWLNLNSFNVEQSLYLNDEVVEVADYCIEVSDEIDQEK